MLIMAEVTPEMGAELRAAAVANKTSVAVEVGRRLERLARLEADMGDSLVHFPQGQPRLARGESLYSGPPNPWDMFRSTGGGR